MGLLCNIHTNSTEFRLFQEIQTETTCPKEKVSSIKTKTLGYLLFGNDMNQRG